MMRCDERGTGVIRITGDLLENLALGNVLPRSFKVIGSAHSENGVVRLIVESSQIFGHGHELTLEVFDAGCTKQFVIVPMRRIEAPGAHDQVGSEAGGGQPPKE